MTIELAFQLFGETTLLRIDWKIYLMTNVLGSSLVNWRIILGVD